MAWARPATCWRPIVAAVRRQSVGHVGPRRRHAAVPGGQRGGRPPVRLVRVSQLLSMTVLDLLPPTIVRRSSRSCWPAPPPVRASASPGAATAPGTASVLDRRGPDQSAVLRRPPRRCWPWPVTSPSTTPSRPRSRRPATSSARPQTVAKVGICEWDIRQQPGALVRRAVPHLRRSPRSCSPAPSRATWPSSTPTTGRWSNRPWSGACGRSEPFEFAHRAVLRDGTRPLAAVPGPGPQRRRPAGPDDRRRAGRDGRNGKRPRRCPSWRSTTR